MDFYFSDNILLLRVIISASYNCIISLYDKDLYYTKREIN